MTKQPASAAIVVVLVLIAAVLGADVHSNGQAGTVLDPWDRLPGILAGIKAPVFEIFW